MSELEKCWHFLETALGFFIEMVVYADDFVCCFEYREEAEQFYDRLK